MRKFNDYFFRRSVDPISEMAHDPAIIGGEKREEIRRTPLFFDKEDIAFLRFFPPEYRAEAYHQLLNDVLMDAAQTIKSGKEPSIFHDFVFNTRKGKIIFKHIPVGPSIFKGGDNENPMGLYEKMTRTVDDDLHRELGEDKRTSLEHGVGPKWLKSPEAEQEYRTRSAKNRAAKGQKGPAGSYGYSLVDPKESSDGRRSTEGFLVPKTEVIRKRLADLYRSVKYGLAAGKEDVYGPNSVKAHDSKAHLHDLDLSSVADPKKEGRYKTPFERMDKGLSKESAKRFYVHSAEKLEHMYSPFVKAGLATKDEEGNIVFAVNSTGTPIGNVGAIRSISPTGEVTWAAEIEDKQGKKSPIKFKSHMPVMFPSKMYPNSTLDEFTDTQFAHRQLKRIMTPEGSDGNFSEEQQQKINALVGKLREYNRVETQGAMLSRLADLQKKLKQFNQKSGVEKQQYALQPEETVELNMLNLVHRVYPILLKVLPTIPAYKEMYQNKSAMPNPTEFLKERDDSTTVGRVKGIIVQGVKAVLGNGFNEKLKNIIDSSDKIHSAHEWNQHYHNSHLLGSVVGSSHAGTALIPNKNSSEVRHESLGDEVLDQYKDYLFQPSRFTSDGTPMFKNKYGEEDVKWGPIGQAIHTYIEKYRNGSTGELSAMGSAMRLLQPEIESFAQKDIKLKLAAGQLPLAKYYKKSLKGENSKKDWQYVINGVKRVATSACNRIWQTNIDDLGGRRTRRTKEGNEGKGKDGAVVDKVNNSDTKHVLAAILGTHGTKTISWHGGADDPIFMHSLSQIRQLQRNLADGLAPASTSDADLSKLQHKIIDAAIAYKIAQDFTYLRNPDASEEEREKAVEARVRIILGLNTGSGAGLKAAASQTNVVPTGQAEDNDLDDYFNQIKGMPPTNFRKRLGLDQGRSPNPAEMNFKNNLDSYLSDPNISPEQKEIIKTAYAAANIKTPQEREEERLKNVPTPKPIIGRPGGSPLAGLMRKKPPEATPVNPPVQNDWLLNLKNKYNQS